MTPLLAIALLVSFLQLSIEVYLATKHFRKIQSVVFSFWTYRAPHPSRYGQHRRLRARTILQNCRTFLRFDIGAVCGIVGMVFIFLFFAIRHTMQLYNEERLP